MLTKHPTKIKICIFHIVTYHLFYFIKFFLIYDFQICGWIIADNQKTQKSIWVLDWFINLHQLHYCFELSVSDRSPEDN